MTIPFIDLQQQYRSQQDSVQSRINAVLEHGRYIMGPEVDELEEQLAAYVGVKHCIAVSSGTDALLVAMMALGIGPDDEVITTPFTFIATGETIALLGAVPVFVDIDPRTFNLDATQIESQITDKTKAIIPVGLFGQCPDMDGVNAVAERYRLPVIEDGAQTFGARYNGNRSCSLSTVGATSFFPSKPLGCYGDGGALFTDDDEIAQALREIRVHGQSQRYYHTRIGVNARIDTLQAAILLAKLEQFDWEVEQRAKIGDRYTALIEERCPNIVPPYIAPENKSVYAQFTVQVQDRHGVVAALAKQGIPTAVHYPCPLHMQPALAGRFRANDGCPNADHASDRVLSLPFHPYLAEDIQVSVAEALREATR